jgi:hypothetical protein
MSSRIIRPPVDGCFGQGCQSRFIQPGGLAHGSGDHQLEELVLAVARCLYRSEVRFVMDEYPNASRAGPGQGLEVRERILSDSVALPTARLAPHWLWTARIGHARIGRHRRASAVPSPPCASRARTITSAFLLMRSIAVPGWPVASGYPRTRLYLYQMPTAAIFWCMTHSDGVHHAAGGEQLISEPLLPLLIATILREEGSSGVQTHVRQLCGYLNERGAAMRPVTPFSWGRQLTLPVFRGPFGARAVQRGCQCRLVSVLA